MIDPSKCEFEEAIHDSEFGPVYYFTYPKDLSETEFYSEEDYGNVVCMCISVSVLSDGTFCLAMSPTVEEGDAMFDVDWRDLYPGVNYDEAIFLKLLKKAGAEK